MKLCKICRNSDILCQACSKKLETGEITQLEVDISRALKEINKNADFEKIVEAGDLAVIITDNPSILIGKNGKNVKQLEHKINKRIKVVKNTNNIKELSKEILKTPIIGVNIKYTPKGEEYVIRVNKNNKKRAKNNVTTLQKISKHLFNKKTNVKFE